MGISSPVWLLPRTHTGAGSWGNNAGFHTPQSSSSPCLPLLIKKKTKKRTLEPCPRNGSRFSPPFIEEKSPPEQPDAGCLLQTVPSLCGSRVGSGAGGRWETCAGSLPPCCDFDSLLQSRRGRTPAAWALTGLVHPLSPAARCCSAQERRTLCTLPSIPPLPSATVHRGIRW